MENNIHELWAEDKALFERMRGNYVSNNEANFFKNIQYKQEHEITGLNDLLISEYENPDEIYLVRMYYDEYLLGYKIDSNGEFEEHVMNLSEVLALNLKELGYINRNLTLLEWLRENDYAYVNYNRNNDLTDR